MRGGGGGSGARKLAYQKEPKTLFPFVNFTFSHDEIWVHGGGAGVLMVVSHSNTSLLPTTIPQWAPIRQHGP